MRIQEVIGQNVRQARQGAGLSQRELGERVGWVLGEDRTWFAQAVSAAETSGGRDWSALDLVAVAWVLKRPVAWFFKAPGGADPSALLEVPGEHAVPLSWVAGAGSAERSVEELATEIERLSKELGRAVADRKRLSDQCDSARARTGKIWRPQR